MITRGLNAVAAALAILSAIAWISGRSAVDAAPATSMPATTLAVTLIRPESSTWPVRVASTGHVFAWQEARIGAELDGLRVLAVHVDVGDAVHRGQVLATLDADIVAAELAEARALLTQAEAEADEAAVNARRVRALGRSGAISAQQASQYEVAAVSAVARRDAMHATVRRQQARLARRHILAPSDGIITVRTATVGAVAVAGQDLFRLIRDGRLEWRAVVSVADLHRLAPGQSVRVQLADGQSVSGTLRSVAPTVDVSTHSGLAYIDLPLDPGLRAGAFLRGDIEIGESTALTLPASALLLSDGIQHVMRVDASSTVSRSRVTVGRRLGDRVEIIDGLSPSDQLVASGLAFLNDGDAVRVVDPEEVSSRHANLHADQGSSLVATHAIGPVDSVAVHANADSDDASPSPVAEDPAGRSQEPAQ